MNLAVATTVILFPAMLCPIRLGCRRSQGRLWIQRPGRVRVEAASPVLIEKVRTAVSDESGQYRVEQLRPGTYSVTFKLSASIRSGSKAWSVPKWLFW